MICWPGPLNSENVNLISRKIDPSAKVKRTTKAIKNIFNLIQTDFLDISMNLSSNTFAPYKKESSNVKDYDKNGLN